MGPPYSKKKKKPIRKEILFKVDLASWLERRKVLRIKGRLTNSLFSKCGMSSSLSRGIQILDIGMKTFLKNQYLLKKFGFYYNGINQLKSSKALGMDGFPTEFCTAVPEKYSTHKSHGIYTA